MLSNKIKNVIIIIQIILLLVFIYYHLDYKKNIESKYYTIKKLNLNNPLLKENIVLKKALAKKKAMDISEIFLCMMLIVISSGCGYVVWSIKQWWTDWPCVEAIKDKIRYKESYIVLQQTAIDSLNRLNADIHGQYYERSRTLLEKFDIKKTEFHLEKLKKNIMMYDSDCKILKVKKNSAIILGSTYETLFLKKP